MEAIILNTYFYFVDTIRTIVWKDGWPLSGGQDENNIPRR